MDWTKVRGGDPIEPAVVGHRVWRYRLGPPLCLLSFCLGDSRVWPAGDPYVSDQEPNEGATHGIHAYLTETELRDYFRDLPGLLISRDYSPPDARWDGVVRGTVTLWGVSMEGPHGYRAQYARPATFDEAHGERAMEALVRLRRVFGMKP
jgi:hypothetical protein